MLSIGFFHNLPTGGAVRIAGQHIFNLRNRFEWSIHFPEGSAALNPNAGLSLNIHPFPEGRNLSSAEKILAPFLLWKKISAFTGLCASIAQAMEFDKVDVVFSCSSMIISAPPLLFQVSSPTIYMCHEFPRSLYEKNLSRTRSRLTDLLILPVLRREKRMDLKAARSADIIIANSSFMSPRIASIYGREPVTVRPGINTELFSPGDHSREGSYFLSVGALSPFKGHHLAIEALRKSQGNDYRELIVVADRSTGKYAEKLMAFARRSRVNLRILQGISDRELIGLYRNAIAVICAAQNEPYGLVPIEAMACGCPVIAVNQGGFIENVDNGVTGLLVPRSGSGIAGGISSILSMSPSCLNKIAANGREFVVRERSMWTEAEKIANLLEQGALPS
ncbi:MAG: glycosyltransferase family 4 protein [Candidatus Aegiribacteria sp.]|nr:glycosyltransferase family 4 protein [Candidatus Aegiribacteria sp.]